MTKEELRKSYLQKRLSLSVLESQQLSHSLCENFFASIDLSFIRVLHIFLPMEEKREPDTWMIIGRIRREFPHIRLVIPRVNNQTGKLEHFFFEGLHQLEKNRWGITEPRQGIPAPPDKIDMVVMPLLAFDMEGNRIGFGKGFYDMFLTHCRPDCRKVGLSLFDAMDSAIPVEPHDYKMDFVVTPREVLQFSWPL